jgi:short-subunit dehydrogenase
MTSTDTSPEPELAPDPAAGLALVTGASSGIGLALAKKLAEHRHDLVIAAEDEAVHAAAEELRALGVAVVPIQVDLSMPRGVEKLYAAATAQAAPVEILALNAGIGVSGAFHETDVADHLRLVDLNVRSTVHLAGLVVPDMAARGSGKVLVTSSIAAVAPGPYHATYAASKAFGHSFAEGIREELKDTGVSVTSLMPGPTDTDFFARAHMEDTKVAQGRKDDPDDVAEDAYQALMAGKASVVAGSVRNKLQAELATHLPDAAAAPIAAQQTKPQE